MQKTRLSLVWFVFLVFMCNPVFSQNQRPTVAVLDFEARGISVNEAATLSDRLITELGNTEAVILVERKQLERILAEQGLQQSGCTSQECVAQVGQLLGVQYMISGSVNKLGDTFTVDAKMFSVETGANVKTVSKTHRGRVDALIPLMETMAWELVGMDKRQLETVAVLDFEGRGISKMEAGTLTDRFTSALGKTGAVLIVARKEMNEILQAQGYRKDDGSCTSVECAAEVGALIGVKNIINGSIGKVGQTYTIDAQMVSVTTGATGKTVNKTYRGEVDGLIIEMELLAWSIVGQEPPRELLKQSGRDRYTSRSPRTRTRGKALLRSLFIPGLGQFYSGRQLWGWGWIAAEAALGSMIYLRYNDFMQSRRDYNRYHALYDGETDTELVSLYKSRSRASHAGMLRAREQMLIYGGLAGTVWLANALHAYWVGPRETRQAGIGTVHMVYNPMENQTQLRWEIVLD